MTGEKPYVGAMVDYVLNEGRNIGEHRPALIVRVWRGNPADLVQLQVFTDDNAQGSGNDGVACPAWRTSIAPDHDRARPGTWHWPESRDQPTVNMWSEE